MAPLSTFDYDTIIYSPTFIIEEPNIGECSVPTTTTSSTTKKNQPLSPSKPKQHKLVSFNNDVTVKETIHILDYNEEELSACWYSDTEYDMIRSDIAYELDLFQNGSSFQENNNGYCSRGLETFSSTLMKQRRQNAINARVAVYDEQEFQWDNNLCEVEYIAHVYAEASYQSIALAHAVGLKDQLEAEQ